jgi:hypothetical protein
MSPLSKKVSTAGNGSDDPDVWMGTKQAARYLGGISPRTLERWRRENMKNALPWVKLGESVRARCVYRKADLDAFLARFSFTSTRQYAKRAEETNDAPRPVDETHSPLPRSME